jgi:hypothetical protein
MDHMDCTIAAGYMPVTIILISIDTQNPLLYIPPKQHV